MSQISRDAEQRHKNKLIRREKCETFKKQAALAFRRGEFEKALSCYNKVSFDQFVPNLNRKTNQTF